MAGGEGQAGVMGERIPCTEGDGWETQLFLLPRRHIAACLGAQPSTLAAACCSYTALAIPWVPECNSCTDGDSWLCCTCLHGITDPWFASLAVIRSTSHFFPARPHRHIPRPSSFRWQRRA